MKNKKYWIFITNPKHTYLKHLNIFHNKIFKNPNYQWIWKDKSNQGKQYMNKKKPFNMATKSNRSLRTEEYNDYTEI